MVEPNPVGTIPQENITQFDSLLLLPPTRRPVFKGEDKPVASVRPVQSTPIPMMPRHVPLGGTGSASGSNPAVNFPINYLQRAGVLVQKIVTTTGQSLLWKQITLRTQLVERVSWDTSIPQGQNNVPGP